jgi:hypothetical protein
MKSVLVLVEVAVTIGVVYMVTNNCVIGAHKKKKQCFCATGALTSFWSKHAHVGGLFNNNRILGLDRCRCRRNADYCARYGIGVGGSFCDWSAILSDCFGFQIDV